jgi:hypothetical protein
MGKGKKLSVFYYVVSLKSGGKEKTRKNSSGLKFS